jgi:DeoR family transcriptional regulator, fructose operon transcriptional repressor
MAGLSEAARRRELIAQQLRREHVVYVAELSRCFGVSEVSIRRDLEQMARRGLLERVHGGAVAVLASGTGELPPAPIPHLDEKRRIGRAAAALVRPGDRVLFDSGTTVLEVARALSNDLVTTGNLTAITCSLPIVQELGHRQGIHLLLLGGIYLPEYRVVVGPQTVENLRGLHADKVFLGTDGLTLDHGVTTANVLEAEVDRAMVRAAAQVIVVADASKIGYVGLTSISLLSKIDVLVTDQGAPDDFLAKLRQIGVRVVKS